MKISLNWLKNYVNFSLSAEELAYKLTMAGMEVEKIEQVNGDQVLELEITPNRPDCLNFLGLARELSAILNKPLLVPKKPHFKFPEEKCDIAITDKEGCSRYVGTLVRDVSIKSAPVDMQQKLVSLGLRPINNVVDITNFCLLETGQPLHAFDYDKLAGGKIIVRRARNGEKIVTIDGVERNLTPDILVIADAQKPVAVAGVMGGANSEVTEKTKNVLLESAYFDPALVRRSARALGLSTDASYRFERGVDFQMVEAGANRALELMLRIAGGAITERNDACAVKKVSAGKKIQIRKSDMDHFLGAVIPLAKAKTILTKLGFSVKTQGQGLTVMPPFFRNDVKQSVDIIEEIARIIGYDALPYSLPQIKVTSIFENKKLFVKDLVRDILVSQGCSEIISFATVSTAMVEKTKQTSLEQVKLKKPLSLEQEILRPSLLPSMLSIVRLNFHRGQKDLRLFEIGKIYTPDGEKEMLSVALTGARHTDWRLSKKEGVDFYDLKGILSLIAQKTGLGVLTFSAQGKPLFAEGQGAQVHCGTADVAIAGKTDKEILLNWDIKHEDVFFAQLDLEYIYAAYKTRERFDPIPEYPAMVRDISIAVKKSVTYEEVKTLIFGLGLSFLKEVHFIEQYLGEKIPEGCRGLVFSCVYQSSDLTLTEDEIQKNHDRLCRALIDRFGATIR